MKIVKLLALMALVVLTASLASAQIAVNPNDDGCWQDLSALRACQAAQVRLAEEQAQRCTSFPEYQCAPDEQPATTPAKMQGLKPKGKDFTSGVMAFETGTQRTQKSRSVLGQNNNAR